MQVDKKLFVTAGDWSAEKSSEIWQVKTLMQACTQQKVWFCAFSLKVQSKLKSALTPDLQLTFIWLTRKFLHVQAQIHYKKCITSGWAFLFIYLFLD